MEHKARPSASSISFPIPKNTTIHPHDYLKSHNSQSHLHRGTSTTRRKFVSIDVSEVLS